MLKTIIIDDEPLAIKQLEIYAKEVPQIEVVATFRSAVAAAAALNDSLEVDLIFCDINMPELSGVEFIATLQEEFSEDRTAPMVIFTTAYAEYAVEGFRLDAVDYLLKPISKSDFERAVKRAYSLFELRKGVGSTQNDEVIKEENTTEYISIKADYKVTMVRIADIIYIESEGEYIRLHIEGRRPITTLFRLKNMEAHLPAATFARIHRSYIVNLNKIYSYDRTKAFITQEEYLPVGQNYRTSFLDRIKQRGDTLNICL